MIFLDTNVLSETMQRAPEPRVLRWLDAHSSDLATSAVVIGEVRFGLERIRHDERSPRLRAGFEQWLGRLRNRIFPYDRVSAEIYGVLTGAASLRGLTMSPPDGMIAAIALQHGAALATRNTRHFSFIGLPLIDPWRHPA